MCGISAIINFSDASREKTARDLARMHGAIAHRGRDGDGFLLVDETLDAHRSEDLAPLAAAVPTPKAGLAFRWLAIQDRDRRSLQPMTLDGRVWLTFNGEVYNFVELRAELASMGVSFSTEGDTEVILAAYRKWGIDCLSRFHGMWAMLIVDLDRRQMIGSRDRFGIKPLFYRIEPGRILFSSELKGLLAVSEARINDRYLYEFLHGHRGHLSDETYYRDLFSVPAASHFAIDLDAPVPEAVRFESWWDLSRLAAEKRTGISLDEATAELEPLLQRAVSEHIRAKVKVGNLISGGLDSSMLTALVRRLDAEPHESYSTVFDRSVYAQFDESNYVDDFVRETGVANHRATFDPAWIRTNTAPLTRTQEEPLIATTLFAQYRVFQTAKEHGATVVLDGQGRPTARCRARRSARRPSRRECRRTYSPLPSRRSPRASSPSVRRRHRHRAGRF